MPFSKSKSGSQKPENQKIGNVVIENAKKREQERTSEIKMELARLRKEAREREMSQKQIDKLTKPNERGDNQPIWELARHRAIQVINSDFNSTINWLSAMVNLLNMYSLLNQAIAGSLYTKIYFPLQILIVDELILGVIKDNVLVRPSKDLRLPNMKYNFKYDDDKGLQISPLLKGDDQNKQLINQLFEKGVHSFFIEKGYQPDSAGSKKWVNTKTNAPLDDATFTILKAEFQSHIKREEPKLNFVPKDEIEQDEDAKFKPRSRM